MKAFEDALSVHRTESNGRDAQDDATVVRTPLEPGATSRVWNDHAHAVAARVLFTLRTMSFSPRKRQKPGVPQVLSAAEPPTVTAAPRLAVGIDYRLRPVSTSGARAMLLSDSDFHHQLIDLVRRQFELAVMHQRVYAGSARAWLKLVAARTTRRLALPRAKEYLLRVTTTPDCDVAAVDILADAGHEVSLEEELRLEAARELEQELDPESRELLMPEDGSDEALAARLGLSPVSVRGRRHRLRKTLRAAINARVAERLRSVGLERRAPRRATTHRRKK